MVSYIDPIIYTPDQMTGIDQAILQVQKKLAIIPWLEKIFGRAIQQRKKDEKQEVVGLEILYPEVWYKMEPMTVMPNDNVQSQVFFYPIDPVNIQNAGFMEYPILATQMVSAIFWGNLQKVDPAKDWNFVEELEADVLRVLSTSPNFRPRRIFRNWNEVYRPFQLVDTFKPYLKPPFFGFRIEGELSFEYLNC